MRTRAFLLILLLTLLSVPSLTFAQSTVRVVVNRDNVNLRLWPALGADVVAFANAGAQFVADARTVDNEWLQVDFAGQEVWIGLAVITILEGDVAALPVRDPRTIPYGGLESPRAGFTDATSSIIGRLPESGVRVRSGPSTAYRVLADAPRYSEFPLLGRTDDNVHVQINYDGVLGWILTEHIEIQGNYSVIDLPIDGVVANQNPLYLNDESELFSALRYMRERIDLAQPSLDAQRSIWASAALGTPPACGGYVAQPTNFTMDPSILAKYDLTLSPLIEDFNTAMTALREAIQIQIDTCGRDGASLALVSVPVVTAGVTAVSLADPLFISLRQRIDALLPAIGADDCVFEFAGRVELLPFINLEDLVITELTPVDRSVGFCFDADPNTIARFEILRNDVNINLIVAISPIESPTAFVESARTGEDDLGSGIVISPINFPFGGRYLLVVALTDGATPNVSGSVGILYKDVTTGDPLGNYLILNDAGEFTLQDPSALILDVTSGSIPVNATTVPGTTTTTTTTSGSTSTSLTTTTICPGLTLTCDELFNCSEVQACVTAGSTVLDTNGNKVACDSAEGRVPLSCTVQIP